MTKRRHFTQFTPFIIYHWRRKRQFTPVFLLGESHGQRSLASHGPWGLRELDKTEVTKHAHMQSMHYVTCAIFLQFSSVQSLSLVRLLATPGITARQASLSITNSWSFLKPMSTESVMPSNHFILYCSLLLLPPIPPSIRVFSWSME